MDPGACRGRENPVMRWKRTKPTWRFVEGDWMKVAMISETNGVFSQSGEIGSEGSSEGSDGNSPNVCYLGLSGFSTSGPTF